jgi:hypothetical protein
LFNLRSILLLPSPRQGDLSRQKQKEGIVAVTNRLELV